MNWFYLVPALKGIDDASSSENSEDDVFVVSLKLELEKMNLPKEIRPAIQEQHERV